MGKRWTKEDIARMQEIADTSLDCSYDEMIDRIHSEFPERDKWALPGAVRAFLKITKSRDIHGCYLWDKYKSVKETQPFNAKTTLNNPAVIGYRIPKRQEKIESMIDGIYDYAVSKNGGLETYINTAIVFSTNDKEKSKKLLNQIRDLVETADVLNYLMAADLSRLFIVRSPRIITGADNEADTRNNI